MEGQGNSKTATVDPAGPGKAGNASVVAACGEKSTKTAVPAGPGPVATPAASAGAATEISAAKPKPPVKGGKLKTTPADMAKTAKPSPIDTRLDKFETFMEQSRKDNNELRGMLETLLLARTSERETPHHSRLSQRGQASAHREEAESEAFEGSVMYGDYEFSDDGQMQSDISDPEFRDYTHDGIGPTASSTSTGARATHGHAISDTDETEAGPPGGPDVLLTTPTSASSQDTEKIGFAKRFATTTEEGMPLHDSQAQSVNYLLTNALEEKYMTETCQKYPKPSNCQNLLVPKVNPLVWENLSPHVRNLDLKLQRCQKPLISGLVALLKATKGSPQLSTEQEDSVALLASAHFELNQLRKELIKPDLNSRYTHLCKPRVKTTEWLFGDDLHKAVKELDEEQKTVGVMKNRHGRQSHKSRRFTPYQNLVQGSHARPHHSQSQRYQNAGWTTSSDRPQQPFLGRGHPPRYPKSTQSLGQQRHRRGKAVATPRPPSDKRPFNQN